VPNFSPHDLRHRRVSLPHLGGMPWAARIGELVGHDDLVTTARTYTHVVADEAELNYGELVSVSKKHRPSPQAVGRRELASPPGKLRVREMTSHAQTVHTSLHTQTDKEAD
jgi:hypothetical protein